MSSMSIRTVLDVVPRLPVETSVLFRGKHGIGKSQVVRQLGRKIANDLVAQGHLAKPEDMEHIDRRLSQMSEGDIIGLPSTDGEVTRFNPPDWFKRACMKPCVLFLDELNRATPEVMQSAFQIVLDRELNGWKLHPLTRVFSAINSSAEYNVNEVDPALLDRFWVIDLHPDTQDWLAWAKNNDPVTGGNIHTLVTDFIADSDKWLDPEKNTDGTKKTTSRRSWERLNKALVANGLMENPNDPLFYPMAIGYVGTEATIAFASFAKSYEFQVSGKDILENYPKIKSKINKLGPERLNVCIEKLSDYVVKELNAVTDKQGKNIAAFMKDLDGELRLSLWAKLTAQGTEKIELAKSVHKHCAELILDVFGVPMGEAGIGVVPNIPAMFQKEKK